MNDRNALRKRLEQDKIEFILVQFVDVHGAAKGKMVPASCLDDALDVGAGFAGWAGATPTPEKAPRFRPKPRERLIYPLLGEREGPHAQGGGGVWGIAPPGAVLRQGGRGWGSSGGSSWGCG